MNNHKPNFASVGKIDDPRHKSRGGEFILLLSRDLNGENKAIFNFPPDDGFYGISSAIHSVVGRTVEETLHGKELSWHFYRGYR